jgi:hypothetical protein
LKKIITKKRKHKRNWKKNHVRKNCSNPQCFVWKATMFSPHDLVSLVIVFLNQLNIKKIKLIKIILEKKHKKTMWKKHCSNPQ